MNDARATLNGAQKVTRAELAHIPTPIARGPRHKPIPHIELIETLEARFKFKLNADVQMEEYAVRRQSSTLFGVMTLAYGAQLDVSAAVGFRHANDMSLSIQLVAGMSVFVCDNMALRGDVILLREKHTTDLSLADSIDMGIDRFVKQYARLEGEVGLLRNTTLTDTQAKATILDAFVVNQVMPTKFMERVYGEYFNPSKPEFAARTGWSLHNAFTQVAKDMPLTTRIPAIQQLGRMMGLQS
jgi:Domain of unknown function (DUF932)